MKPIRVAAVQMEHTPNDKEANLARMRALVERAAHEHVAIPARPK